MIFNSIKKSVLQIILSPWTLLPFLAFVLFMMVVSNFIFGAFERVLVDLVLYYENLAQSNLPYILLTQYPLDILAIILAIFVSIVVSSIALLILSRIAKGEDYTDAINESILNFSKAIGLSVFIFAASIVVLGILIGLNFITNTLSQLFPNFAIILGLIIFPILLLAIITIILVKLSFVIPALIDNDIKKALQKSWNFSNKRFLSTLSFIIILIIINIVIEVFAQYLVTLFGQFESIILIISAIISATFYGLAIANYYFNKEN